MTEVDKTWEQLREEAVHLFKTFQPRATHEGAQQTFDVETIRNVHDFFDYASAHLPVADDIDHGYWPTICLYWPQSEPYPIHIEIFEDHFEFWRRIDLKIDVSHFEHIPGETFPAELASILSQELR